MTRIIIARESARVAGQRLAMYIVISMPNRNSIACGVSHFMADLLRWLGRIGQFTVPLPWHDNVASLTADSHCPRVGGPSAETSQPAVQSHERGAQLLREPKVACIVISNDRVLGEIELERGCGIDVVHISDGACLVTYAPKSHCKASGGATGGKHTHSARERRAQC